MTKLNFLSEKFDRRNPLRRKILKRVKKVGDKLTTLMLMVLFAGMVVGAYLDISGARDRREAVKEDVKERCTPLHNVLDRNTLTTTYECPDGTTYQISERI